MSLQILVDMNLTPDWIPVLSSHGFTAVHWSTIGNPRASDRDIMAWAVANQFIVFTHDLDFGTALALTHAFGPSVIQLRTQAVLPESLEPLVVSVLQQHSSDLLAGALIIVDESNSRVRVLPL